MLKPLRKVEKKEPAYASDSPQRVCEKCGKTGPSHRMINCIICIGSPGHETLAPFQCQQEEHWACSIECWSQVAHACIDEHMTQLLTQKHGGLENDTI